MTNDLSRKLEWLFAAAGLFVFAGAVYTVVVIGQETELAAEGYPILQRFFYPIYLVTLGLLALRYRLVLPIMGRCWPILLICLFALMSALWSIEPAVTLQRATALLLTTAFGFYLAASFPLDRLLILLGWTFGAMVVLSVVFALAIPSLGLMFEVSVGAWRGVFTHKNTLGEVVMYTAAIHTALLFRSQGRRWPHLAMVGACFVVGVLADSASSLMVMLLLPALVGCVWVFRLDRVPAIAVGSFVLAFALLLAGVAATDLDTVLGLFGRDTTLTGRSDLWAGVWHDIQLRPTLGYGFGAYWYGYSGPGSLLRDAVQWDSFSAHNGWLETWLGLGAVGVVLAAIAVLRGVVRAIRLVGRDTEGAAMWPFLFLISFLVINIVEAQLLEQNKLCWVLFVAALGSLVRSARRPAIGWAPAPAGPRYPLPAR